MADMEPLLIEVVSDVVCPWCFIGTRRLDAALNLIRREFPDFDCIKRWRPFFLNPTTPPQGEPYLPFLIDKFGSLEKVEAIFQRVRDAGAAYGLAYHFDKIKVRANTFQAHRLIHWAQQHGDAQPLVEPLYVGQFQLGENVSDPEVLAAVAVECGYDGATVVDYLRSSADTETVLDMAREARKRGINVVPTFVVGGTLIIPGAEDPAILADGIRQMIGG